MRRSHCEGFKEKLDEHIDQLQLEELINQKCNSYIAGQELDCVNEIIMHVLHATRRHAEGIKRAIKCAPRKTKSQSITLCYFTLKRKAEGKQIDREAI